MTKIIVHARLLLAATFLIAGTALAQDDDSVTVAIDADQPLGEALQSFADQSGLQVIFFSDVTEGIESKELDGEYTAAVALDTLLADTGLTYTFLDENSVSVQPVSSTEVVESKPGKSQPASSQVLMAQNQTSATQNQSSPTANNNDIDNRAVPLEEIIVTGSNIRGVEAVGVAVVTLDREYIELSGIATTTELIQSIPQNFGLGNEAVETVGVINGAGVNWGYSSGVNLRGLGSDSTLILLNGRRSASGGSAGGFVDLNTIPTAAIERVEILPDGASAIYGSDAVAGVVNVILRNDYEGVETNVRYAPGISDIDEIQFNQMFGKKWSSGNALFSYEYYDRSELQSADREYTRDSDLTSLGGDNNNTNMSNPGNIISPFTFGDAFAIPSGQDGTALTPADLIDLSLDPSAINLQNIREGSYVLPKQTRHSVFISARQELSSTAELFVEARYSRREFEMLNNALVGGRSFVPVPESNAFFVDPFAGASTGVCQAFFGTPGNCVMLDYNFGADFGPSLSTGDVESYAGTLGARFSLSNSWEVEVSGSFGAEDTIATFDGIPNTAALASALADSDPTTAFNPFGDGSFTNPATLAAIEEFLQGDVESDLETFNVRVDGDLFETGGGTAKLAVGAEYRKQSLFSTQTSFTRSSSPDGSISDFDLDRDVSAAFVEIYLPLVTEQNSRPGIRNLAVSLAGRYEDYSDFGDTFDPKLGVSWSPTDSFKIRGTVGTSFRAPLLQERNTSGNGIIRFNLPDNSSPTGRTQSLIYLGKNPDLTPQEGATWTAGFDVAPKSIQGFEIGLTYYSTEVDDLIQRPTVNALGILNDPALESVVTRCPPCTPADVTALFNDPIFSGTPIPPDQIGAIVDNRVQNIAKVELSGVDLSLAYAFDSEIGAFNLSLYASHIFDYKEQVGNSALVDRIDTIAKPTSQKARSSLSWNRGGMNAGIVANYIGDYIDDLGTSACAASPCKVDSWTTWDAHWGYDFSDRSTGFLSGTRVLLSVQNVFDRDPPFVEIGSQGVGFDAIGASPLGRYAAIQLTKSW